MLTLTAGYGKKIYPDWLVTDIVRRMHEDYTLTSVGLFRQLLEEQVISPQFNEWQIESFVNSNPRFRSMFILKFGEEAYRAWKGRHKTASLCATAGGKPPMDFSSFHRLAVRLAIHTNKKAEPAKDEESEDED